MNKSQVIISSTLDPRHVVCDLLDVDKMTLVWAFFRTGKITWSKKPKISQYKISVEKATIVTMRNIFGERKNKLQKNCGPLYLFKSFKNLFKSLRNPKYSLILGTMLYFWLFNFPI